jgi:hypothetical protein
VLNGGRVVGTTKVVEAGMETAGVTTTLETGMMGCTSDEIMTEVLVVEPRGELLT